MEYAAVTILSLGRVGDVLRPAVGRAWIPGPEEQAPPRKERERLAEYLK